MLLIHFVVVYVTLTKLTSTLEIYVVLAYNYLHKEMEGAGKGDRGLWVLAACFEKQVDPSCFRSEVHQSASLYRYLQALLRLRL